MKIYVNEKLSNLIFILMRSPKLCMIQSEQMTQQWSNVLIQGLSSFYEKSNNELYRNDMVEVYEKLIKLFSRYLPVYL